jgi:F-type H+-transporting ATPase subunit a
MITPLHSTLYFSLGPVPITQAILTTWAIMLLLVVSAVLLRWQLRLRPAKPQARSS